MTPTDADDDRTLARTRQPGQEGGADAGFQKTEWSPSPGAGALAGAAMEKTVVAAGPRSPLEEDMAGNLPVGTRLAEFEITRLIGEGGFGIVYLAHDHSLQRRVALKEYMPSSLAARAGGSQVQVKSERHRETFEAGLKSFINEARLLASFDHPALVKVYRFWEANGTAYMVMPFLEGTTMKDVLKRMGGPPDEAWLRSVLGPLTEALQVIHAEQCYHRDIAPDNVMLLTGSNRWLLLDFGAARRVIGDMTQALTVILKPGYAPVEQYAEIPGMKQGPWTDVYALAAVIYFAITGRTPPPSVGRLLNDTYLPLSRVAAGRYGAEFLAAVDRALAVRPEQRIQTIDEFRDAMGLAHSPLASHSAVPPTVRVDPAPLPVERSRLAGSEDAAPRLPAARPVSAEPSPATGMVSSVTGMPQERHGAEPTAPRKIPGATVAVAAAVVVAAVVGAWLLLAPKATKPGPGSDTAQVTVPSTAAPSGTSPAQPPAGAQSPLPAAPRFEVVEEFMRVVQAQTPGFDIQLTPNLNTFRIGRDKLSLTVQSERDGYLTLLVYGPDGVLTQLFPNDSSGPLRVRKGQILKLAQGAQAFPTAPPAGPQQMLALVSAVPRDFDLFAPRKDDIFRIFPTGAEAAQRAAAHTGPQPSMAGHAVCPTNGAACDQDYGATLVRVDLVP